jgi:hypothetical protein
MLRPCLSEALSLDTPTGIARSSDKASLMPGQNIELAMLISCISILYNTLSQLIAGISIFFSRFLLTDLTNIILSIQRY